MVAGCRRSRAPTVADYFGMEAGIFVPSATMAGQIAFKVWTRPGDFIIIEEYGHGYYFESGAMGAISGALPRLLKGERGVLQPADVRAAIEHPEYDFSRAALAVLENTANWGARHRWRRWRSRCVLHPHASVLAP